MGIEAQVPSPSVHGTTCIRSEVVGESHSHPNSTGMIRHVGLIYIICRLEARTGWQVVANWGCPGTQRRQVRVGTAFLRICEKLFHCLHCCLYESIRPRIHRSACNVIEPVSYTKDPKLFRAVMRAIIGDQPFRNSMLLEDFFEMIDESARADVWQFSYDNKLAV